MAIRQNDPRAFELIDSFHSAGLPMTNFVFTRSGIVVVFDKGQIGICTEPNRFSTKGEDNKAWKETEKKAFGILRKAGFSNESREFVNLKR